MSGRIRRPTSGWQRKPIPGRVWKIRRRPLIPLILNLLKDEYAASKWMETDTRPDLENPPQDAQSAHPELVEGWADRFSDSSGFSLAAADILQQVQDERIYGLLF